MSQAWNGHGQALVTLLLAGAVLGPAPAGAQVQQQQRQSQQQLQSSQQQQSTSNSQLQLQVQLPPQSGPDATQCPDTGSFVAIGPTARRGEPITAQSWNDCADLPQRGAIQQPTIGAEIPLPLPQFRTRR